MLHKDHKKLKLQNKKLNQNKPQNNKVKTLQKADHSRGRSTSTTAKNNGLKGQNSSLSKTHKTKPNTQNRLSIRKSELKTFNPINRKRLISQLQSKQPLTRQTKSLQKKQVKYIFNPMSSSSSHLSLSMKPKNTSLTSHSKCYSNQTLTKQSYGCKSDALSSFAKTSNSDFTKIKKKKHDYIKSFAKTSCLEKTLSSGFYSMGYQLNDTLGIKHFDRTGVSEHSYGPEQMMVKQKVTDSQLEVIQLKNDVPKLSQIRLNVSTLFKKLKSPNKTKLLLISNSYEKIVSDLYTAIKKPNLPNLDISRIDTSDSNPVQKENQQPKIPIANTLKHHETLTAFHSHQPSLSHQCPSDDQSEHWDSYLNLNSQQYRNCYQLKNQKQQQKQPLKIVKMLNLQSLKQPGIKQYQQEFMDLKDGFSQSWKRQISQQARY